MPDGSTLVVFILASLALLLIPGPNVLYIVARGIGQGRRAGFASVLGVGAGSVVHISAAALGLSALLLSSATAFAAVKYLGAAYLIVLGLRTMRAREEGAAIVARPGGPAPLSRVFAQGLVINVLNPKVALFFVAFLPQFVDPDRGSAAAQIFALGVLFATLGVCTDSCYALLAGTFGNRLRANARFLRRQRLVSGGIYLALGVTTALTGAEGE